MPMTAEEVGKDLRDAAIAAFHANAAIARDDPNEFNAFVLRDEETGLPVENSRTHVLMQTCIDESDRTIILAHIESGKTNAITVGRTLYELGHNQNMRGALVSVSETNANKFLRSIKHYIEFSPEYHATFPAVKKGTVWQETQIIVQRTVVSKDATLMTIGPGGGVIGARLDWVVCDDLLDHKNTATKGLRDDLFDWFHSTIIGRLTRNAKVVMLGTAWHAQDILHRLARRKVWFFRRFPVWQKDPATKKMQPTWPERWSVDRIMAKREELGDFDFERQCELRASDDEEARFKSAYIVKCCKLGNGLRLVSGRDEIRTLPAIGSRVFEREMERNDLGRFTRPTRLFDDDYEVPICHGVDLAGKRTKNSAFTVLFSIAIHPNQRRQVLRIKSGQWDGPQIIDEIALTNERFGGVFMVENNATQSWIMQFTRERVVVPLLPFTTGRNKANPQFGVESLAVEMQNEGWIIPCDQRGRGDTLDDFALDDEVENWITQLREYERSEHTGDHVMASWFARECARRTVRRQHQGHGGARVIG